MNLRSLNLFKIFLILVTLHSFCVGLVLIWFLKGLKDTR